MHSEPMSEPPTHDAEADATEAAYLRERERWLVRLRWYAVAGVAATALVASYARVIHEPVPIGAVALVMAGYNLWFWRRPGRDAAEAPLAAVRVRILAQLMLDVAALAVLLHFSDGVENPFATFFAFLMVLGGMLLTRGQAVALGAAACALHGGFVLAEYAGLAQHHPIVLGPLRLADPEGADPFWKSPLFVAGHVAAFATMVFGVGFFVRAVVERRLRAEAEQRRHERVALSREKLAHVGEISAGVAHAVRNPLHGLLNCVDLLEARAGPDPAASETLALMAEGLRRIESVTRRLLVLTREAPASPTSTNVDALVTDSIKFMAGRTGQKSVAVRALLGGVGAVELDADRVGEALVNVIDNAVDASKPGSEVTVITRLEPGEGGAVTIEVVDRGVGMAPEQVKKIFDPFFTTKPVGEGTGLGLAIAKRVLDEHGGCIRVASSPGEGTSVRLELPGTAIARREHGR